jgi:UrcA family protein
MKTCISRGLLVALGASGLAMAAAPALAQTVGELTVIGKWGPNGPTSLSRAVDISDLDLRSDAGVSEMKARVRATADDICNELEGKGGGGPSGLLPSCQNDAIRSAQSQMNMAIAQARSAPPLAYAEPAPAVVPSSSVSEAPLPSADVSGQAASATAPAATYTMTTVTNGPVPDTPENRARFGGPMSNAGKRTAPAGN